MFRLMLMSVIVILAVTGASASDAAHERILNALELRNFDDALNELVEARLSDPGEFTDRNYEYLQARIAEMKGDHAVAMAGYEVVSASRSPLREYAIWRMSQIARFTGNYLLERILLEELRTRFPESLLISTAHGRIARSYYEGGNHALAIGEFGTRRVSDGRSGEAITETDREALRFMARSHLALGNDGEARALFERLVSGTPNRDQPDDLSLDGVRGLDQIDTANPDPRSNSAEEHFRRGQVYQFNRDFTAARAHFLTIVHEHPRSAEAAEALYQIGRGYTQEGNFSEATNWFERLLEQYPNIDLAKDALLQAASVYASLGKHREAVSRYRRYIDRYPEDERVDRAYLNIIDISRDQGEETAALRNAATAQKVFRGKVGEAQALFAEARIHISIEDWEKALDSLERLAKLPDLGGVRVPGGTNRAEVHFMRAYMLEQLRRYREAIEGYISITDGREQYYGWRASERLRSLADNEMASSAIQERLNAATRGFGSADVNERRRNLHIALRLTVDQGSREQILEALKLAYNELPEYAEVPTFKKLEIGRPDAEEQIRSQNGKRRHDRLGRELFFIGLYDEAAPELEAGGELTGDNGQYMLAETYRRGDRAERAIAFMEPLWRRVPVDFQIELMPADAVAMLYPAPFRDAAKNAAVPRNVDPRFLMAIARQESRFRPDVKSAAAARGMMQFIGSTAVRIANELRVGNFDHDALYDPETALLFGAQYVNELLVMFPNQPDAAAAGYNGGEDNARRWLKRSNSNDPERYVPEIAYSQTKDYVYKIMANYRVYRFFYDAELSRLPDGARTN